MTSLKKLDISHNIISEDCYVKVFQTLSQSSVTTLNITYTGFCNNQSELFLVALKQLIDPSCGRLEVLLVGDSHAWTGKNCRVMDFLSTYSSLKSLTLCEATPSLLLRLTSNTNLTELNVSVSPSCSYSDLAHTVRELVVFNKTLKHLRIAGFELSVHHSVLKVIMESLQRNETLQKLTVHLGHRYPSHETAFEYVRKHDRKHDTKLTLDPRIVYTFDSYFRF